jgi:hypothetical protein
MILSSLDRQSPRPGSSVACDLEISVLTWRLWHIACRRGARDGACAEALIGLTLTCFWPVLGMLGKPLDRPSHRYLRQPREDVA